MSIQACAQLVNQIRLNNGIVIDDDTPCNAEYKVSHVSIRKVDGKEIVVPIFQHDKFPISRIYLGGDGRPHMQLISKQLLDTKLVEVFDLAGGFNIEV